ncbi:MAG: hypothetical protein EP326_02865 [Deltaproteobacteria bacterium]|nr:MAG: hypothetical protein EP326_02865 [Deltaproteobacteria bacterium]
MEQVTLNIDGVDYTSIGRYMDNNDGISFYIPTSENPEDWIKFLRTEDPIILLWTFSHLYNDFLGNNEVYGKAAGTVINADYEQLTLFLKKYCWQEILDEMFIDFIFGPYSDNGGNEQFPKIIINGKQIEDKYEFDYGDHVFIDSKRYDEFMQDLGKIKETVVKALAGS